MSGNDVKSRSINLVVVLLLIAVSAFAAYHEGYFPLISLLFGASIVLGFAIAVWLAVGEPARRFVALVLSIYIIEYVKESIGIRSGVWTYHGIDGHYDFGVWMWVLAGLIVYTLATRVTVRLVARTKLSPPRWVNVVIFIIVAALIPAGLGPYRSGAGMLFIVFYVVLFVVGVYASARMPFKLFAALVVTSWAVANLCEYAGSIGSGVWTYNHNTDYPPLFLLFGCWPLEIIAQYSLSAFLSSQPLDRFGSGPGGASI
jgi:hypothetical protein